MPCIDAMQIGSIVFAGTRAIEYRCPPDSPRIERLAQHGEGAYAGHTTLAWSQDGIDYLVSSHGYSTASRMLAEDLARSITLTKT